MRVYIAAPYPERVFAQQIMRDVEAAGHEVTSTWLRSDDKLEDKFARLDLADVARADVLVALSLPAWTNKGTGGRHVEFGYALAHGKPIVLVGERANIFHYLDDIAHVEPFRLLETLDVLAKAPRQQDAVDEAVSLVVAELRRAEAKHKPLNSHHEGYAVLQEEVDELWEDVKADRKAEALREAVQVAAMGLRFLVNLTPRREAVRS